MKNFKKISFGLPVALALAASILLFGQRANAAEFTPTFWEDANYTLQDENTIHASTGGQRVTFDNPDGNTYPKGTYKVRGEATGAVPPDFCAPGNTIIIKNPSNLNVDNIAATISVVYKISTADSRGNPQEGCRQYSNNNLIVNNPKVTGKCNFVVCSKDDVKNLSKTDFKFTSANTVVTTFKNKQIKFTDGDIGDNDHTYQAPSGFFCSGSGRDNFGAITISDANYKNISKSQTTAKGSLDVDWYDSGTKKCNDYGTNSNKNTSSVDIDAAVIGGLEGTKCSPPGAKHGDLICGGKDGVKCNAQGCVWASTTQNTGATPPAEDSTCETNIQDIGWIGCPVLRMLDGMFSGLNGLVEGQLNFCTGESSTAGGNHCKAKDSLLTNEVRQAWSIFRVLATSLLVIIMLVMVFSQAINSGIFDAYTVKKLLPRLVVAAIVIQLSWNIFKFMIDLSNDVGQGIANLMFLPFGGVDDVQLAAMVDKLGGWGPEFAAGTLFIALIGGAIFSAITFGGIALLAISAIASLIVGLMVLLFREILIIMAMILVPIALIAWILPGTQKYWKLWQDNFTKLLLMFPLIMGLIASGRIFAYVGGQTGDAENGVAEFLGLIIIFVGFFGPYFILPKTFNWGGQMFGALANGAWNGTKKFRSAPARYGMEQAKGNRAQRATDRNERLSYGRGRRFDRVLAAAGGFGLNSRATAVREARNKAEGREAGEKAVSQSIIGSRYEKEDHPSKLEILTNLAQGQLDPKTGLSGDNPAMQRWALDQLAKFGDWDIIDGARTSNNIDERVWQDFVAKNIGEIHGKAPYLSPIKRNLSALGYQESAGWKTHTAYELERQLTNGEIRSPDGKTYEKITDPDERAKQLRDGIDFATRALDDDRVRASLDSETISVFERIKKMDSTDVRVIRPSFGRGPATVNMPSPDLISKDATARQNLSSSILAEANAKERHVTAELAGKLADESLQANDRSALEDYLKEFKDRAEATKSAEAISAYNNIISQWNSNLASKTAQAEQAAIAEGKDAKDVINDRIAAQNKVNAEQARMAAAGLTRI